MTPAPGFSLSIWGEGLQAQHRGESTVSESLFGKRINRRTLLGGIAGTAGAAILAACGSNAATTAPTTAPTAAATATKAAGAATTAASPAAVTTGSTAATTAPAATAGATTAPASTGSTAATTVPAPASTTMAAAPTAGAMSAASTSQTLNGQSAFLSKFQGTVGQGSNIDTLDITGKQIKLTFYHTQTKGNEDSLKKIIMDFQAMNPGITIDAQSITGSYTGVSAKIRAGLQANQVPDIAVGYENDVANYQQADAVLDLTPYINSKKYGWTKEDLADIFPGFLDRNLYSDFKDQILSAPFTSSVLMMWYNNDMLKTLGFTGPAKTWDELKMQGAAAVKAGKKGWPFSVDTSQTDAMVFSFGGDVITADNKKGKFDTPQAMGALQVIEDMAKAGTVYQVNVAMNEDQTAFINGEVPFYLGSSTGRGYIQDVIYKDPKNPAMGDKFDWNGTVIPQSADNLKTPATALYGGNIILFKGKPENQLASWLFVKYFTSRDQTAFWGQKTGYMPVRKSAADSADYKAFLAQKPVNGAPISVAPYGKGEPKPAGWSKSRDDVTTVMTQLVNKQITAADASKQMQSKVNADLAM